MPVADSWVFGVPLLVMLPGLVRAVRSWRLQQLAAATTYLLGPGEPMLAGEVATLAIFPEDYPTGSLAVAVTKAHVVVFRIDGDAPGKGQPRRIVMAGPSSNVQIEFQKRLTGLAPGLAIRNANQQWTIRGLPGLMKPDAVLEAWRQGAKSAAVRVVQPGG